jgi:hypothetical protein
MKAIETIVTVTEDGRLVIEAPVGLSPGSRRAVIVVEDTLVETGERPPLELPCHDSGPWPEALSLRREDMYDD